MKKTFKVDGMSCEHCKKRVETALLDLDGVDEAIVSLEKGTADVEYNQAVVSETAMTAAIEDAGYDVV